MFLFSAPPGWTTPCLGRVALAQGGLVGGCTLDRWIYAFMQYCVYDMKSHTYTVYIYTLYMYMYMICLCYLLSFQIHSHRCIHDIEFKVMWCGHNLLWKLKILKNNLHTFAETHHTDFCNEVEMVAMMVPLSRLNVISIWLLLFLTVQSSNPVPVWGGWFIPWIPGLLNMETYSGIQPFCR